MTGLRTCCILGLLSTVSAFSRPDSIPAARQHVRFIDGAAVKYTSKLSRVVELNFNLGDDHLPGKQAISAALDRIAAGYGLDGKPAFEVRRIASSRSGSTVGEIPTFSLEDLLSGEVIVANNISYFNQLVLRNKAQSADIEAAIHTHGRGYLAFHVSADGGRGWKWYTDSLEPRRFQGHSARIMLPVYKDPANQEHIVLQGILDSNVAPAEVPDGLDSNGLEKLRSGVPVRRMKHEYFRWGRDIAWDSAFKDRVTVLLKRDSREATGQVGYQYVMKGGDAHTYLYRVGKAMTSYIPAGHENDEVLAPATGFDGGVGDFDRYVAQTLFFLAGYRIEPCDASCEGLPVVDAQDRLTGGIWAGTVLVRPRGAAKRPRPAGPIFDVLGRWRFSDLFP